MYVYNLPLKMAREEFERWYITELIIKHNGKISEIAREIKVGNTNLWRKMKKLGLLDKVNKARTGQIIQNEPLLGTYSPSEQESTYTRNQRLRMYAH